MSGPVYTIVRSGSLLKRHEKFTEFSHIWFCGFQLTSCLYNLSVVAKSSSMKISGCCLLLKLLISNWSSNINTRSRWKLKYLKCFFLNISPRLPFFAKTVHIIYKTRDRRTDWLVRLGQSDVRRLIFTTTRSGFVKTGAALNFEPLLYNEMRI